MGNAHSFALVVIAGILIIILGLAVKRPLLYALGASEATFPYADDYISIYLLGSVFVMISMGMNGFINCQGFARIGMLTVLIGAVINIVLDPVFIFLFHMGVRGAAIATVISQAVSALWIVRFPDRTKDTSSSQGRMYETEIVLCKGHSGSWAVRLYHAGYQLYGADCLQCHPAEFWRGYLCWSYDHYQFREGGLKRPGQWIYPGGPARNRL